MTKVLISGVIPRTCWSSDNFNGVEGEYDAGLFTN